MRRYKLGKKELKNLNKITSIWNIVLDECEVIIDGRKKIYLSGGLPYFLEEDNRIYPTVIALLKEESHKIKKVVVDSGAVKHIENGANVFVAGIVEVDEDISPGDIVGIYDEKYRKPIGVGIAEMTSHQMKELNRGLAIRTISHIGDYLWKEFLR